MTSDKEEFAHRSLQKSTIIIHQSIGVVPQERWFPLAKIRRVHVETPAQEC